MKKKMLKALALTTAAVMAMALFAACGGDDWDAPAAPPPAAPAQGGFDDGFDDDFGFDAGGGFDDDIDWGQELIDILDQYGPAARESADESAAALQAAMDAGDIEGQIAALYDNTEFLRLFQSSLQTINRAALHPDDAAALDDQLANIASTIQTNDSLIAQLQGQAGGGGDDWGDDDGWDDDGDDGFDDGGGFGDNVDWEDELLTILNEFNPLMDEYESAFVAALQAAEAAGDIEGKIDAFTDYTAFLQQFLDSLRTVNQAGLHPEDAEDLVGRMDEMASTIEEFNATAAQLQGQLGGGGGGWDDDDDDWGDDGDGWPADLSPLVIAASGAAEGVEFVFFVHLNEVAGLLMNAGPGEVGVINGALEELGNNQYLIHDEATGVPVRIEYMGWPEDGEHELTLLDEGIEISLRSIDPMEVLRLHSEWVG